jgi:CubicO group peptidase (beta-lactamase class C family)
VLYEGAFGLRALDQSTPMTLDTVFRIASMTKAITSVAAMQLVEQGKLKLEEPVPNIDPGLGSPQVLEGFDAAGAPKLRPAKRPITLRHLLTHTAGFSYDIWDADTGRYVKAAGLPARTTGKLASLRTPLSFDPGDKWEYGINIDWAGRLVEVLSGQSLDVYFRDKIFAPLGMKDSGFRRLCRAARAPGSRARAPGRRRARTAAMGGGAGRPTPSSGRGGGPLYSTGTRLPHVSPDAAQRRKLERRAAPEVGHGRGDEQEPYRQHSRRHHEDAEPGAVERRRPVPRGPRSDGDWATCSTCRRGRTAGAPAR